MATADDIYVTSAGGARYPPQVIRIDARDGTILNRRTTIGQPNGAVLAPDGRLWVVGDHHDDQPVSDGVSVFDASTLLVVDTHGVPGVALSIARVGSSLWVGSRGQVFELDAANGTVTRTFAIAGSAYQMVGVAGGGVVVAEGSMAELLDANGVRVAQRELGGDGSLRLASAGDTLWARTPSGDGGEIRRLDPHTLADVGAAVEMGSPDGGIVATVDGGWAIDRDTSELVHLGADGIDRRPAPEITGVLAAMPDGDILLSRATGVAYASDLG